ncbi:peptidoglycan-associated lipoprotein [Roseovarius azorensis]|uniref:Peptidoglycan-associated lipoprotein n=2 Tax=Roseovarius azorensis TaxID=1287727 RepID=A0A1H7FB17_9RHOB|nr:peptidoglycan-associated lipoprotein [Roseovarius azorensis]
MVLKAKGMTTNGAKMTYLSKTLILCAGLALAACTNPNRFDDGGGAGLGGAGGLAGSAQDPTSAAYFQQAIGDRVLFAVDQSTLSSEAQATLEGQAQWLMTNRDFTAVIEGHADEQGTREYNLALGARRANAVQEYLISRGVSGNRLRVVSYGKERPIEICSDESCYQKNRRAVTVLAAGLGS